MHSTLRHNATVVSYLRKEGGTRSRDLPSFVGNSPDLPGLADSPACRTHSVSSECDSRLSIKPLSPEWQIDPRLFEQNLNLLPMLSIDFFVTCRNALLQDYLSPFPDMSMEGIDALSHTWDFPGVMYAFPPASLLTAVLGSI